MSLGAKCSIKGPEITNKKKTFFRTWIFILRNYICWMHLGLYPRKSPCFSVLLSMQSNVIILWKTNNKLLILLQILNSQHYVVLKKVIITHLAKNYMLLQKPKNPLKCSLFLTLSQSNAVHILTIHFLLNLARATDVGNDNRLRWMYRKTRQKHVAC